MGLSASQARLLSITQRLSNNELQSEIMANNKIRLSEANVAARDKYISSLDSTKMDYISYDDTGIQESVALTFNSMTQYTSLKNQYNLYNTEGQILVSTKDAENFKNSTTLYEFLTCYGLFDKSDAEFQKADEEFKLKDAEYKTKKAEYETKLNKYLEDKRKYEEDLKAYEEALNAPKVYDDFNNAVATSSHYRAAKSGTLGCFLHILGNLLDFDGSTSATKVPYNTSAKNPDGSIIQLTESDIIDKNINHTPQLTTVSDAMSQHEDKYKCDKKDFGAPEGKNLYQVDREAGKEPSIYTQLMSDYVEIDNGDGTFNYELKTLKQKDIDLYYLVKNWSTIVASGTVDVKTFLEDFVEGDMKGLNPDPPKELPPFNEVAPEKPKRPVYIQKMYDQPLAQWYINLWNAMEGNDKSDKLSQICDENANFGYYTTPDKMRASTFDASGKQVNQYYQVIDRNLTSDADWLQFAITNGIVTMKQAALRTNGDITWEGIEFSSTSDIREVEDSSKIAKAEAEYKKSMYEIQAQDKEYDMKIKKLDTEHSALKQEADSIKNVMSKNVEKSFTVFS